MARQVLPRLCGGPQETPPFWQRYCTIADGDKNYPIMWRIKLREGKDRPKLENGQWAFQSKFEIMEGKKFMVHCHKEDKVMSTQA